jgi:hypothetical protein
MEGDMFGGRSGERQFDLSSFNWWGLFILLIGVAWLGDNMNWWTFEWSMVGPIALIFAGVMVVFGRKHR